MRIKAFSLIELIVVILLVGTIFSIILNSYMTKNSDKNLLSLKDITTYLKKELSNKNGTLYIYGKSCKKGVYITDKSLHVKTPNFGFAKENIVLKTDNFGNLNTYTFDQIKIENKKYNVCFELKYKKDKFIDKFIVSTDKNYYLFLPIYQNVEVFNSLDLTKQNHTNKNLYPNHIDKYYHEK